MSYDLQLLPRGSVETFLQRYESQDAESLELNPGPVVAERETWKRALRDALIGADARFVPFPFDHEEIARMDAITEAEARARYRHIELNLPDDDPTGIQVTIYDETAALSVPYWHAGASAESVFRRIWGYLRILEQAGGLVTHDPQLDRVLDLSADFDTVVGRYLGVVMKIPEIIAQSATPKKPWWKLW